MLMHLLWLAGCGDISGQIRGGEGIFPSQKLTLSTGANSISMNEGTTANITFLMSASAQESFDLNWRIAGGSSDFHTSSGLVTVPKGSANFVLNLQTIQDSQVEGNESFTLTVDGEVLNAPAELQLQIVDDDVAPSISISDATSVEGSGAATYTVSLSNPYSQTITIDIASADATATAGSDYTTISSTLTIAAGVTSVTGTVAITDDATDCEPDETLSLMLSNPSSGTFADSTGVVTIRENDLPALSISDVLALEGQNAVFSVTKSGPVCGEDILFDWITQDGTATGLLHYTPTSGNAVTLAAADSSKTLNVPVLASSLGASKTFQAVLANPNRAKIADATGVATIAIPSSLSISDLTVAEGDGAVSFTVALSSAFVQDVSVQVTSSNGTATAGSDYTAVSTTLTILAGSTSVTGTLSIADDATSCEPDETLALTLSSPVSAVIGDATATATIRDNDLPTLSINDVAVVEGIAADFTVSKSATPACAEDITFSWRTQVVDPNSGDYTAVSATTVTIPAASTSATLNVATLVNGDTASETFKTMISSASRAFIADGEGIGTIAAPKMDLDLRTSLSSTVGGYTAGFTRASTGTYFDSDRILKTAAIDQPRFDHNPLTGKPVGLLIEESRTNYFTYSTDLSFWDNLARTTSALDVHTAPDGSLSADRLIETSSNGTHYSNEEFSGQPKNNVLTFSVFLKPGGRTAFSLRVYDSGNSSHRFDAEGDLTTQTMSATASGNGSASSAGIIPLANGWFRVFISGIANSAGGNGVTAVLFLRDPGNGDGYTYTGDPTKGLYVWGAQLEQGAIPTSYIPTGTTTVARSGDQASVSDLSWFQASSGTFLANAFRLSATAANDVDTLFSTDDNTSANRIQIKSSGSGGGNRLNYSLKSGNTDTYNVDTAVSTFLTGATSKAAIAFEQDNFRGCLNGALSALASTGTVPSGINNFRIGVEPADANYFNGHVERLSYFANGLNAASLQSITQPDSKPTLYIEDTSTTEGSGLTFTIKLSQTISSSATIVNWTASSGTGTLGTDTSGATSGTVTIPANSTSATFTISTSSDSIVEESETLTIALSGQPASVIAGDLNATGMILDASFSHDFITYPNVIGASVPRGLTFTRASTGTYFDSAGLLSTAVANLLLHSSEFSRSTSWTTYQSSVNHLGLSLPGGSGLAQKLLNNTANDVHTVRQTVTLTDNTSYTLSVYAKAAELRNLTLEVRRKDNTNETVNFDLSNGSRYSGSAAVYSATSLGNGWYRLTMTFNAMSGATTPQISLGVANNSQVSSYVGDGYSGLYIWGAQLELGSAVSPYVPTANAINYAPRYDHDPATCVSGTLPSCARKPLGLLSESQSTNLVWPSAEIDHANFSKSLFTVTANTNETVDPMGTNTAEKIVETSGAGYHYFEYSSSTSYTGGDFISVSIYLKQTASNARRYFRLYAERASSGDAIEAQFDLQSATVSGTQLFGTGNNISTYVQAVGNSWYRYTLTGVPSTSTGTIKFSVESLEGGSSSFTGDGVTGFFAWGVQLEFKPVPTSYIPTSTIGLTRSADLLTIDSATEWFNASGWTAIVDFSRPLYEPAASNNFPRLFDFCTSGTCNNDRITARYSASSSQITLGASNGGAATAGSSTATTHVANQIYQTASIQSGGALQVYVDGVGATATGVITLPTVNSAWIGGTNVNNILNGHYLKFQYVPRVLNSGQLISITTD